MASRHKQLYGTLFIVIVNLWLYWLGDIHYLLIIFPVLLKPPQRILSKVGCHHRNNTMLIEESCITGMAWKFTCKFSTGHFLPDNCSCLLKNKRTFQELRYVIILTAPIYCSNIENMHGSGLWMRHGHAQRS